jgi:hypothetical protein
MASTITITCPECSKEMKVPAEVLGKKIRCKGCETVFAARGPAAKAAPARPPAGKAPAGKAPAGKTPAGGKPAAKAAPGKPPAGKPADKPAKKPSEDDEDANPYGVTVENLSNRCPDCANELESEGAVICLHCGYNTVTRTKARTRKVRDVTGGDKFFWLLPGIVCVLVVILLITGDLLYCLLLNDESLDKDAWYFFIASLGMKLWLVVVSLFFMYLAGKFAIRRLIFDNQPPEVELTK